MAYREYRKSGRTLGKVLYQLHTIGIPLRIVEMVTVGDGTIKYGNELFATYQWQDGNIPVFNFKEETYSNLQKSFFRNSKFEAGSEFMVKESVHHLYSGKVGKLKMTTKASSISALIDFGVNKFFPVNFSDLQPVNVSMTH